MVNSAHAWELKENNDMVQVQRIGDSCDELDQRVLEEGPFSKAPEHPLQQKNCR